MHQHVLFIVAAGSRQHLNNAELMTQYGFLGLVIMDDSADQIVGVELSILSFELLILDLNMVDMGNLSQFNVRG